MGSNGAADDYSGSEIAIVGMAGRFPGAPDVDTLWDLAASGRVGMRRFSDRELLDAGVPLATLRDPDYVKVNGTIDTLEWFDAGFFGIGPRDAAIMDPQHRHFLEAAWEVLEHAGHPPSRFDGPIGVFAGCGMNGYFTWNLLTNPALVESVGLFLLRHTSNDRDFLATQVAYQLNLTGPAISVQTACSTSLVAVHLATQSLLSRECDMALAGGVTYEIPHRQGYLYHDGEILSPDGVCRAFDHRSAGTVLTSGLGVVALRRYDDAVADGDVIHAVIRGTAVNNDGSRKVGFLAPSVDGHAAVVVEALAVAGVDPDTITYLEAHGTGTSVGDPIEVAALTQAFRTATSRSAFCHLGSTKPSIGHLDTAAGVASLIKTTKALQHKVLPPLANFEAPNPIIDFDATPFVVSNEARPWNVTPGTPRRAGVSSLGVGGTNVHAVLEEAPLRPATTPAGRDWQLLVVSGRTETAARAYGVALARHLARSIAGRVDASETSAEPTPADDAALGELADVAYTMQVGREAFAWRRAVAVRSAADALAVLSDDPGASAAHVGMRRTVVGTAAAGSSSPPVVFMFPGGGAQYPGMGRDLYDAEPVFRRHVDECLTLLEPLLAMAPVGRELPFADLRALMYPAPGTEDEAAVHLERATASLPAVWVTSYAMAQLWMSWGVEPAAMTGHSLGEYVAACIAGVLSLPDALSIVMLRARLFEQVSHGGGMLSVPLAVDEVRPLLPDVLSIAAVNSPTQTVVSGRAHDLAAFEQVLLEKEVEARRVNLAIAPHSAMLDEVLPAFRDGLRRITFHRPVRRFISNLTGTWITDEDAVDPEYWVRHLRRTVRFSDGLAELCTDASLVFLEVGPGQALGSFVRQQPSRPSAVLASLRHVDDDTADLQYTLTTLGRLWTAGVEIDWNAHHHGPRRRVALPTYPWERQRYWIDPGVGRSGVANPGDPLTRIPTIDGWWSQLEWRAAPAPRIGATEPTSWLVLADGDPLIERTMVALRAAGHRVIEVRPGERFERSENGHSLAGLATSFVLPPADRAGWSQLLAALTDEGGLPRHVLHSWLMHDRRDADSAQARGLHTLIAMAQAFVDDDVTAPVELIVLTAGMQQVAAEPLRHPEHATVLGACRVIPREQPNVACRSIDVEATTTVEALITELTQGGTGPAGVTSSGATSQAVAYRGASRFAQEIAVVAGPRLVTDPAAVAGAAGSLHTATGAVRPGGTYLITGGYGGLGLVVAEHLARTANANVVLVGRHPRPTPGLEAARAEVLKVAADVTDVDALRRVVAETHRRFGPIHGVFHAAGVLDDGLLPSKTIAGVDAVLAPKVAGTLALDDALRDEPLEFMVLFSSTSALLGLPGQVDYAAANAFVDAYAAHRRGSDRPGSTVAIAWGAWRDRGMTARGDADPADALGLGDRLEPPEPLSHAVLDRWAAVSAERVISEGHLDAASDWIVAEHRLKAGRCVLPGMAAIDLIATAARETLPLHGSIEIRDLSFVRPLEVPDDEPTGIRVDLRADEPGAWSAAIESRPEQPGRPTVWRRHAGATVMVASGPGSGDPSGDPTEGESQANGDRPRLDLDAIGNRLHQAARSYDAQYPHDRQSRHLDFGPRWDNLVSARASESEVLAELQLPSAFEGDIGPWSLHPALLDRAVGIGLGLIDGFRDRDDLYVPFEVRRAVVHGPVPSRVWCLVRLTRPTTATDAVATFDVTLAEPDGRVCVVMERLSMRRLENVQAMAVTGRRAAVADMGPAGFPDHAGHGQERAALGGGSDGAGPRAMGHVMADGITAEEGLACLDRLLGAMAGPGGPGGPGGAGGPGDPNGSSIASHLICSPFDLVALERAALPTAPAGGGDGAGRVERPELGATFTGPRDDVERELVDVWQEILGIAGVGIHDDFFDLGGHSLIAVRLFSKIRKAWAVDLGLSTLFNAPTVAELATLVREERDLPEPPPSPTIPTAAVTAPAPVEGTAIVPAAGDAGTGGGGSSPSGAPASSSAAAAAPTTAPDSDAASGQAARGRPRRSSFSCLVPIQRRGGLRPVYIVHGRTGHVMNFQPLALRMAPDRPVFGIQAHGLDGRSEPDRTIEAMARRYVSAVREAQPVGPYILGGFSGGGVVAFEMAHQLTADGETVAPLVLLDTIRPGLQQEVRWDYVRYRAKEISRDPVQARQWVKATARLVRDRLSPGETPVRRRSSFGPPDERIGDGAASTSVDADNVLELTDIYLRAQDDYTMRRWDGRAVLFRASRSLAEEMGSFQVPADLLWSPFVEHLDIFQIPGGHTDMMLPPNVDVLAERLRLVLSAESETETETEAGSPETR